MEKQKIEKSVAAEIRAEQKEALKHLTWKKKLEYFWEYYKIHAIIVVALFAFVYSFASSIINAKDTAFYAYVLNSYTAEGTALSDDFAAYAGIDLEEYDCFINSTSLDLNVFGQMDVALIQAIMATMQAGNLDVMLADYDVFDYYTRGEAFEDLRALFTEEELAPYQEYLYYIDTEAVAAAVTAATEQAMNGTEEEMTEEERAADMESHRHPENMKNPIPVGVFMSDSAFVKATDSFPGRNPVFGIIVSSQRPENAKIYLEYLWTTDGPTADTLMN